METDAVSVNKRRNSYSEIDKGQLATVRRNNRGKKVEWTLWLCCSEKSGIYSVGDWCRAGDVWRRSLLAFPWDALELEFILLTNQVGTTVL